MVMMLMMTTIIMIIRMMVLLVMMGDFADGDDMMKKTDDSGSISSGADLIRWFGEKVDLDDVADMHDVESGIKRCCWSSAFS